MKYLARRLIERAIRDLQLVLQPRAKGVTPKQDEKQNLHNLHSVKDLIDTTIKEISGEVYNEPTDIHQETEKLANKLINEYFNHHDIGSIRALASALIVQLSVTQAQVHCEAFQEHYEEYIKDKD